MEYGKRKVGELSEFPTNPRQMSKEMFEQLVHSVREFGLVEPIVVNKKNQVVGGNHRLKVLKQEFGDDKEVEVVVVDFSPSKEQRLNIALNGISGEFENDQLKTILQSLQQQNEDILNLGFTKEDLQILLEGDLKTDWSQTPVAELTDSVDRQITCPFCQKSFVVKKGEGGEAAYNASVD